MSKYRFPKGNERGGESHGSCDKRFLMVKNGGTGSGVGDL
jgi:hypothetical protein